MLRDALVLRRFMLQLFIVWLFHRYRWPENWLFYGFVGIIKQTNNLFFSYHHVPISIAWNFCCFFFNRLFIFLFVFLLYSFLFFCWTSAAVETFSFNGKRVVFEWFWVFFFIFSLNAYITTKQNIINIIWINREKNQFKN